MNEERTVLVTRFGELGDRTLTVALRAHPGATWGPPVAVEREP